MKKIILFFLFLPTFLVAQINQEVDLSSPNSTLFTHLHFLQKKTYNPEKSAKTVNIQDSEKAIDIAIKIKRLFDGKGLMLDFTKIPNNPDYKDTLSFDAGNRYTVFPMVLPLISIEKKGDNWYFSEETIENIDDLYSDQFPWYIEEIQELIPKGHVKFLNVEVWQVVSLLILVIFLYISFVSLKKINFVILNQIIHRFVKNENFEIITSLKKLAHPLALVFVFGIFEWLFPSLHFSIEINKFVFLTTNIFITVFWIYVLLKLSKVIIVVYKLYAERTPGQLDNQFIPILKNFLYILIIIFGVLKMATFFNIDPTHILAGASIGGVAIAFASQDTVKNMIGTLMIFLDKPFRVGDWISAGSIDGTVEQVGFRSSLIRGADTTLFQIPNSQLSELVINNFGLRHFRRYRTNLGLRYDTPPALLNAFIEGVREIITQHPRTKKEGNTVEFVEFGDSSLNILVNVFIIDLAWDKEQRIKHELNIAFVELAAAIGVEFAFPSQTLFIEQFPDKQTHDLNYKTDNSSSSGAIAKTSESFIKRMDNEYNKK